VRWFVGRRGRDSGGDRRGKLIKNNNDNNILLLAIVFNSIINI